MNKIGGYKDCTNCNLVEKCCSTFDEINSPVLNKEELTKIRNTLLNDDFYIKLSDELYQLKTNNNQCIFYQNGKCSIYDLRPTDCKLYPFDIIKKDLKYYLIIYLLDCIDSTKLIKENANLDDLVNYILPWIEEFTDERNYTKMKKLEYRIIKEIK